MAFAEVWVLVGVTSRPYRLLMDTTLHVVCDNPECVYFSLVRKVRMLHLGAGVYVRPQGLVCECQPRVDLRSVTPEPVPPSDQMIAELGWAVTEPTC